MPIDVTMPKLSDSMEAGTIVRWLKQPGQEVKRGEALAEVETDKADVEVEASDSGTLLELRVPEGKSAPVGAVIAVLGVAGEAAAGARGAAPEPAGLPPGQGAGSRPGGAQVASVAPETNVSGGENRPGHAPAAPATSESRGGTTRASPLARQLAAEAGVDLATLAGSGPGGRIVRRDVEATLSRPVDRPAPADEERAEGPAAGGPRREGGRLEPPSRMRLAIARRMSEAKRDIPHFYVRAEVDMGECMRLRASLKASGSIPHLTVTHLIVKAMAVALRGHSRVNASWREDGSVEIHGEINPGIAVALDDGLIVPVLHGAGHMTLAEVAAGAKALTDKARSGKFSGQDLAGSTISLSNVGMLDVDELVAVINPPHAAVLAVAAVKERPVVRGGRIEVGRTMSATLSCDHRVLNGIEGAAFLQDLKHLLEDPVRLLVE